MWYVNSYFKEVFVLEVTFCHNLLEQCCNLCDKWKLEFRILLHIILQGYVSYSSFMCFQVYLSFSQANCAYG